MVRKFVISVALAFLATAVLNAQNHKVTLQLKDATNGEAVGFATVSLVPEKGNTKYTLSDGNGNATLEKIHNGKYTLKAEIMGYKTHQQTIEVKADVNLGVIKLEQDTQVLDAAAVTATGNPIIIKKDTIEYNASSFKISDDNMLVDLLKKLPGIEVSEDGTITSNGETISKITIAGKTFFLDDPQLASQNIPAKLVEKVKVVKKKSEQAEFTGIDDGEEETVIDLTVQKGMMNGVFGNAMAGGGHDIPSPAKKEAGAPNDWRWQGAFMGGRFTETSQLSVILNANNTNNRGFNDLSGSMMNSMMGGGGGMGRGGGFGGNSNGITTSWMGGVNGNWDLLGDKMDLGGNYLYNGSIVDVSEATYKETYMTDGSTLVSNNDGMSHRFTDGHRFGVRLEHKFSENTSTLFQPQFNFGRGSYWQQSEFDSFTFEDGFNYKSLDPESEEYRSHITNEGFTNNTGENSNWQARGFLLLRQRLGIPGRTISLNADWNFSNNQMAGFNQSRTQTRFDEKGDPIDGSATEINQRYDQSSKSQSASARLVYTEPLGGNFYLEGSYNFRWSRSETEKLTYDSGAYDWGVNPFTLGMGVLAYNKDSETKDLAYSNNILNWSINHNFGFAFMYQNDKIRAQLGASAIPVRTYNETYNHSKGQPVIYDPGFIWNFSPRAMLFYDFNDNSNIRLFYFGNSSQPSSSQLNPVLDNSNPLSLSLGNPYLNPYFNHRLRSDIEFSNKQTFFTARVHLEGGMVQSPITNASWYDQNGRAYSFPVNGNNTYSSGMRVMINAPIARSNFSISNMTNLSYSMTGSSESNVTSFKYSDFHDDYYKDGKFIAGDEEDFKVNTTHALSVTERLRATYRSDNWEIIASGRTRMSKPWYTLQTATQVAATWNNQVSASVKWTIGNTGIELGTDANYNWYNGYTTPQEPELVWNATFSMPLFKRQATLSLKAYDILDQAKNVRVASTDNYYTETTNNTLGRYIMLSFTWRFGNFGEAGKQMRSRMGGGPGRMGPPMGGRPF